MKTQSNLILSLGVRINAFILSLKPLSSFFFIVYLVGCFTSLSGQAIDYVFSIGDWNLKTVVDEDACHQCEIWAPGHLNCFVAGGMSYSPDGRLYALGQTPIPTLYEIDFDNNICTFVMSSPSVLGNPIGLLAMGGGIFYSLSGGSDNVYRWDATANTVTIVGATGFPAAGDLCLSNGNVYYLSRTVPPFTSSVIKLNLADPANSEQIVFFDGNYGIVGLSATLDPNVLMALEIWIAGSGCDLYRLNLQDGSLTLVCEMDPIGIVGGFINLTSLIEHNLLPYQPPYIDLDCDDSSGAMDADFNSLPYDCLSEGSGIVDVDPRIKTDGIISQMTIKLTNPIIDAPNELLDLTGTVDGISVIGMGTPMLTLTNLDSATLKDFLDQLAFVIYQNKSFYITPGLRTVEVQFTTISGSQSNVATANIVVEDLPHLEIDLGPDIMPCEGETVILSVHYPDEQYLWSTGEQTEDIMVTESGIYTVTVTSSTLCPNRDTVVVDFIPNIQIWLTGDTLSCKNGEAQLYLTTDAPFPINVTVTPDPGIPITLEEISGTVGFIDEPFTNTEYTITEVIPSQPACVILVDDEQFIDVWPVYSGSLDTTSLCLGDSILLGNTFYTDSGQYAVKFQTIHGCDSFVNFTITLLPTEHLYYTYTTCDPTQAGTTITLLPNANGCDTVVHTTYTLLPTDTTMISTVSCRRIDVGLIIDSLINQFGCDSIILYTTLYDPPKDTTFLQEFTCDSAAIGLSFEVLHAFSGCDSLVQTSVSIAPPDTTVLYFTSCDSSNIGTTEILLSSIDGCDSLVISHTLAGANDTTYFFSTSCDSMKLGTFITSFPLANACDSIVIRQVNFSFADSTFISESSCFTSDTGLFVTTLSNQFGCDSIVFNSVNLLPSYSISFSLFSCMPQDTGLFVQHWTNQWGCDSIHTTTVSLLPAHTTFLYSTTCDVSQSGQFISLLQNEYGCDSTIILKVDYLEPDTTILTQFTCEPMETGVIENTLQNEMGCDSLVRQVTLLYQLPQVSIYAISEYNGYTISCNGGNDGILGVEVVGVPGFQYLWSTGDGQPMLENVSAGIHTVSVTDGNGCQMVSELEVTEPDPLEISFTIAEPECFDHQLGTIIVDVKGGAGPFQYSIDSTTFTTNPVFNDLGDGLYKLFVLDQNGCQAAGIIGINVPMEISVELGENIELNLGDTAHLSAIVSLPFDVLDSIFWTGLENTTCDNCLQQMVSPIVTSAYSIQVINTDGCMANDELTITVIRNDEIFIPNVFSPNGDGINDLFQVSVGAYVNRILDLQIFDRWGNQVFRAQQLDPTDPQLSWNGTFHQQPLNPGVYAYKFIAQLKDGTPVIRHGTVTLIR